MSQRDHHCGHLLTTLGAAMALLGLLGAPPAQAAPRPADAAAAPAPEARPAAPTPTDDGTPRPRNVVPPPAEDPPVRRAPAQASDGERPPARSADDAPTGPQPDPVSSQAPVSAQDPSRYGLGDALSWTLYQQGRRKRRIGAILLGISIPFSLASLGGIPLALQGITGDDRRLSAIGWGLFGGMLTVGMILQTIGIVMMGAGSRKMREAGMQIFAPTLDKGGKAQLHVSPTGVVISGRY